MKENPHRSILSEGHKKNVNKQNVEMINTLTFRKLKSQDQLSRISLITLVCFQLIAENNEETMISTT